MTSSPDTPLESRPLAEDDDLVVLLGTDRRPIGSAPREGVHSADTPLHLAFSCWLFDNDGKLLLTRRALGKRSWPGVWTNSFCGHPRPGEAPEAAVRRHGLGELGVDIAEIAAVLPDFAYRAVDASGVVENEVCPVFTARAVSTLVPNPDEVVEHQWVSVAELRTTLEVAPWALSPWVREQAATLDATQGWDALTAVAQREAGSA